MEQILWALPFLPTIRAPKEGLGSVFVGLSLCVKTPQIHTFACKRTAIVLRFLRGAYAQHGVIPHFPRPRNAVDCH